MEAFDRLYRLYRVIDTDELRQYQEFVDLFPAVDSRVALEHWQEARDELDRRKEAIRTDFVGGETLATVAAHATRDQAFTALDLLSTYGRAVNVLVLDVDETLRTAGSTDNEIPRETLHFLTELHEGGMPIVFCTGQTLENVKGFAIQGLGSEIVHSGRLSIVYEGGSGVFTPGHGPDTKRLLYEDLDPAVQSTFGALRSRLLPDAPETIRTRCHPQGNEFNVTLKPNFNVGSDPAIDVIEQALEYMLDLVGDVLVEEAVADEGIETPDAAAWTRATVAAADPEIRAVLEGRDAMPAVDPDEAPETFQAALEALEISYYAGDAVEVTAGALNKVAGVEAALEILGVDDPFALVMGDSKSDLRVMEWAAANGTGIAAAPAHASTAVLEHVLGTDELVFEEGDAVEMLRTVYALEQLAGLELAPGE